MIKSVETYLAEGCMRCQYGGTPQCKVHTWNQELVELRRIVLACGLTEAVKWSMPCYTINGKNVLIVGAFKQYCSINFFKGGLLQDTHQMLIKAGPNSHESRQLRFTAVGDILKYEDEIKAYIFQAIAIEEAGLKFDPEIKNQLQMPEELMHYLTDFPEFKKAFEALTPGRQRGYIYHIAEAKQAKTRLARIEKHMPNILIGKGLNE